MRSTSFATLVAALALTCAAFAQELSPAHRDVLSNPKAHQAAKLRDALRRLARRGGATEPVLLGMTACPTHTDPTVRAAFLAALAKLGPNATFLLPAVEDALSSQIPAVRRDAALALEIIERLRPTSPKEIVDLLFSSGSNQMRGLALAKASADGAPILILMAQRMATKAPMNGIASKVAVALRKHGAAARPHLLTAAKRSHYPYQVLPALLAIEADDATRIATLLELHGAGLRLDQAVRQELVKLGAGAAIVPELLEGFAALDTPARQSLLQQLPSFRPEWSKVWPALGSHLGSWGLTQTFAELLRRMNEGSSVAIPDLRRVLTEGEDRVGAILCWYLRAAPPLATACAAELVACVQREDGTIATEAIRALAVCEDGTLSPEQRRRAFAAGAAHPVAIVRVAAIQAALRLGPSPEACTAVHQLLRDEEPGVQSWAQWAAPYLVLDGDGNPLPDATLGEDGMSLVGKWLSRRERHDLAPLVVNVYGDDSFQSATALDVLRRLGRQPTGLLDACRDALKQRLDQDRVRSAALLLASLGKDATPALSNLQQAQPRTWWDRRAIFQAMAACGEPGARLLAGYLDRWEASEALAVLAGMGDEARPVLPRIRDLAKSQTSEHRQAAASALEALGTAVQKGPVAAPVDFTALPAKDNERRARLLEILTTTGLRRKDEITALRHARWPMMNDELGAQIVKRLDAKDEGIQNTAIEILARRVRLSAGAVSRPPRLTTPLREVWLTGSLRARELAGFVLRVRGMLPTPAPSWFHRFVDDPLQSVRSLALQRLARAEDPQFLPVMIRALEDPDRQVRMAALYYLRSIGSEAKPALPALRFVGNWERRVVLEIAARCGSEGHDLISEHLAREQGVSDAARALAQTDAVDVGLLTPLLTAVDTAVARSKTSESYAMSQLRALGLALAKVSLKSDSQTRDQTRKTLEEVAATLPPNDGIALALGELGPVKPTTIQWLVAGLGGQNRDYIRRFRDALIRLEAHDELSIFLDQALTQKGIQLHEALATVPMLAPDHERLPALVRHSIPNAKRGFVAHQPSLDLAIAHALGDPGLPEHVRKEHLASLTPVLARLPKTLGAFGRPGVKALVEHVAATTAQGRRLDLPLRVIATEVPRAYFELTSQDPKLTDRLLLQVLEQIGPKAEPLLREVAERLSGFDPSRINDPGHQVAVQAARTLGCMGPAGERELARFLMLEMEDFDREQAPPQLQRVLSICIPANAETRELFQAIRQLTARFPAWGPAVVAPVLLRFGRRGVAELERLHNSIPRAVDVLAGAARSRHEATAIAAIRALGRLRLPAGETLAAVLANSSTPGRARAWAAITLLDLGADGQALENAAAIALDMDEPIFARRALEALAKTTTPRPALLPLLIEALRERSPRDRILAAEAMRRYGKEAQVAEQNLRTIAADEETPPEVRAILLSLVRTF